MNGAEMIYRLCSPVCGFLLSAVALFTSMSITGCNNPTTTPAQSSDEITVTLPQEGDVWKSWTTGFSVEWEPVMARTVSIEIYKNEEKLDDFTTGWISNNGSYTRTEPLPCEWEAGSDYTVVVTDDKDHTGESACFVLDTDLDITSPKSGDIWYRSSGNYQVIWSPPPAPYVKIEIWLDDVKLANFTDWVQNSGIFVLVDALPDSIGIGDGYCISVVDNHTNIGYRGFSEQFTIDNGAEGSFGMEFAVMLPGTFDMGAPPGEEGSTGHERPVHEVTIAYSYQILSTEVTQNMWTALMGFNPSHFVGGFLPVENGS